MRKFNGVAKYPMQIEREWDCVFSHSLITTYFKGNLSFEDKFPYSSGASARLAAYPLHLLRAHASLAGNMLTA